MIASLESAPGCSTTEKNAPSRVEDLTKTVSASRLGLWQQCRLKWYFKYVLKLTKPPTPARHMGKVVHAVLQAWNKARWRNESLPVDGIKTLFDGTWAEQQRGMQLNWEGEEESEKTGAWSLLDTYFKETPIKPFEKPEGVEVTVEADLASHGLPKLIGIIDLVRAGGRIVDFKTTAQKPNEDKAVHMHETQTSCYSVLYRESTGHEELGVELHHLVKTKTPKVFITRLGPMTPKQETRLFRSMESFVEGVQRKDFVPSPGFHCAACEFFLECRRWDGGVNA
jgi:putative RecB family exonuclease